MRSSYCSSSKIDQDPFSLRSWLQCVTTGFAVITPYFACRWYVSSNAEQRVREKDQEINATVHVIRKKLDSSEDIDTSDVKRVIELHKKYALNVQSAQKINGKNCPIYRFEKAVHDYNREKCIMPRQDHIVESELSDLLRLRHQASSLLLRKKNETKKYGILTILCGLTVAGLYIYSKKSK